MKERNNLYLIGFFLSYSTSQFIGRKLLMKSDYLVNFHSSGRQWARMLNHCTVNLCHPASLQPYWLQVVPKRSLFSLAHSTLLYDVLFWASFYTFVSFATRLHRISDPFISMFELAKQWKWEIVGIDLLSWCLSSLWTNNKPSGTVAGLGLKLHFLILVLSWLAKYIVSNSFLFF